VGEHGDMHGGTGRNRLDRNIGKGCHIARILFRVLVGLV
jgi:hypothetical protein